MVHGSVKPALLEGRTNGTGDPVPMKYVSFPKTFIPEHPHGDQRREDDRARNNFASVGKSQLFSPLFRSQHTTARRRRPNDLSLLARIDYGAVLSPIGLIPPMRERGQDTEPNKRKAGE
jgi:hypothetical protein